MKKLMIALAVAAVAVASQAATFQWSSNTGYSVKTIDITKLNGNGEISDLATAFMKNNSSLTATLTILSLGGEILGSKDASMVYTMSGGRANTVFDITPLAGKTIDGNTDYKFKLEVTGTQNNMKTLVDDNWDYTDATITWTYEGALKTAPSGTTTFGQTLAPTSWTVSGAVAVPEPTSGLLLLLGVAGMALRRRRA